MNLFDQPLPAWSDRELEHAKVQCARQERRHRICRRTQRAESMRAWCTAIAEEQDRRRQLTRAVDEATTPRAEIVDWRDDLLD